MDVATTAEYVHGLVRVQSGIICNTHTHKSYQDKKVERNGKKLLSVRIDIVLYDCLHAKRKGKHCQA